MIEENFERLFVRFARPADHAAMFDILTDNGMKPSLAPVYFVAEEDGRIVGGGGFFSNRDANVGWVASVAVAKDMKRKGVGAAIVGRNVIQIRNVGLKSAWLETYFWNTKFYNSVGFSGVSVSEIPEDIRRWRVNKRCRVMVNRSLIIANAS